MGNHLSTKNVSTHDNCNSLVMFSSQLLTPENRRIFEEREHESHILVKEIFKSNFSSPINDLSSDSNVKILDVGCGPGFWLVDMASCFPKASLFGIDLKPVYPTSTYPRNVKFRQHDLLNGLPFFEDNTFDFINIRFLVCDFTESQWKNIVYRELARVLKPGGWLEVCDPEFKFYNVGPIANRINSAVCKSLKTRNIDPLLALRHSSLIKSTSLFSSDVKHQRGRFPLGSKDELGKVCALHISETCKDVFKGPIRKELKEMNVTKKDLDELVREFESKNTFFYYHRYYVQK